MTFGRPLQPELGECSAPEQPADITFGYLFQRTLGERFNQGLERVTLSSIWRSCCVRTIAGPHADVAGRDHNGVTAPRAAAACDHEAVAKQLLDHRADMADTDHTGFTVLRAAAAGGHEDVAKRLLDHAAGMAAASHGWP